LLGNQTEEFYKEAAVMRELRHPNIVSIFGIMKKSDKEQYMVIELMPLGDLRSLLRQKGSDLTLKQLVQKNERNFIYLFYLFIFLNRFVSEN